MPQAQARLPPRRPSRTLPQAVHARHARPAEGVRARQEPLRRRRPSRRRAVGRIRPALRRRSHVAALPRAHRLSRAAPLCVRVARARRPPGARDRRRRRRHEPCRTRRVRRRGRSGTAVCGRRDTRRSARRRGGERSAGTVPRRARVCGAPARAALPPARKPPDRSTAPASTSRRSWSPVARSERARAGCRGPENFTPLAQSRRTRLTDRGLRCRGARTRGHSRTRRTRPTSRRSRGASPVRRARLQHRRARRPSVPGGEGASAKRDRLGGARVAVATAHHGQSRTGGSEKGGIGIRLADRPRGSRCLPAASARLSCGSRGSR